MEGYYVIRTYEAGKIGEKTKFFVPGVRSDTERGRRYERNVIKKQEQNEYSSLKALARLINANASDISCMIGLDYSDEGLKKLEGRARKVCETAGADYEKIPEEERENLIYDAAAHEAELLLRRVARTAKEEGRQLKYIVITSDMDGETGERVRVHHHLLVSAGFENVFSKKWLKNGTVNYKTLRQQDDYTPIAKYFADQVRRIPDAKKYRSSRNLIRPVPKDRIAITDAEVRVPKGGQLLFRSEFVPHAPQYIRYVLPKNRWKLKDKMRYNYECEVEEDE